MRTIDALSAAAAEALNEEEEILKRGTSLRLLDTSRRQAFFLALHREGRICIGNLALWAGRPRRTVWGIIKAARDLYAVDDPLFLLYYEVAQQAIANWHHENPDDDD